MRKKTSLNNQSVAQRGRNREEAVLKSGVACEPLFVKPILHDAKGLSSEFRQNIERFIFHADCRPAYAVL
jgi:hypothetical protein